MMLFEVTSGEIFKQIEAKSHGNAVKEFLISWEDNIPLGLCIECKVVNGDPKWYYTQSELKKLDIAHRMIDQEIRGWKIV